MGAKNRCIRVDDATWELWQTQSKGSLVQTLKDAMSAYAQSESHMQCVTEPAYAPVTKVNLPYVPPKKVEPPLTAPKRPKNRACEVLGHNWTVQGLCSRCGDSK